MKDIYYLINGERFLDNYLLREQLQMKKGDLQHLMETYTFPESEVVIIQNKKLYSMNILTQFVENLIERNER